MEITFGWCGGEISDQLEADEEEKRRRPRFARASSTAYPIASLSLDLFSENNWKKKNLLKFYY